MPAAQRFLMIYSGILTLAFILTVLYGFTDANRTFNQITVHRINVVECQRRLKTDPFWLFAAEVNVTHPGTDFSSSSCSRP